MDAVFTFTKDEVEYQATRRRWETKKEVGHGKISKVFKVMTTPVDQHQQQQSSSSTPDGSGTKAEMAVAVKMAVSDDAGEKIRIEAQHYDDLGPHPHLLPVLVAPQLDGKSSLVTPYIPFSLQDILDNREHRTDGPYEGAVFVSSALFRSLAHLARSSKVHRDAKPGNLLVEQKQQAGGAVEVSGCYIIDFDILSAAGEKHPHHLFSGSYGFASPEAIVGAENIGTASDVFCAGAVTASMLLPEQLFRLQPGDNNLIRRRLLESLTSVLGEIGDDALQEMDVKLQDFEKPQKKPEDQSKLEALLQKSGLPNEKLKFFQEFLPKCLKFKPTSRPTAFSAFHQLYGQASEEERGRMPLLNEAEKEAADTVCGGREEAKMYFSTVYK